MKSFSTEFDKTRDPVCVRIEEFLNELSTKGTVKLELQNVEGGVVIRFGRMEAEAINCDIALVRLAMQLLEDPEYASRIREILAREMREQTA